MFGCLCLAVASLVPAIAPIQDAAPLPPSSEIQHIILVRHGESRFNVPDENGVLYIPGQNNAVPLTEKGEEQARQLALHLIKKLPSNEPIVLCSSTAKRAHDTAVTLFKKLHPPFNCQLGDSYEGLCELSQGPWEGLPQDETYYRELSKWEQLSAAQKLLTPRLEGGESFQELIDRALPELQRIVDQHRGKTIILVTHYVAMNALTLHWSGARHSLSDIPGSRLPQIRFNNCDMLLIELDESVHQGKVLMHIQS